MPCDEERREPAAEQDRAAARSGARPRARLRSAATAAGAAPEVLAQVVRLRGVVASRGRVAARIGRRAPPRREQRLLGGEQRHGPSARASRARAQQRPAHGEPNGEQRPGRRSQHRGDEGRRGTAIRRLTPTTTPATQPAPTRSPTRRLERPTRAGRHRRAGAPSTVVGSSVRPRAPAGHCSTYRLVVVVAPERDHRERQRPPSTAAPRGRSTRPAMRAASPWTAQIATGPSTSTLAGSPAASPSRSSAR